MVDLASRIAEVRVTGLADPMGVQDGDECCLEIVNVSVLYTHYTRSFSSIEPWKRN
jgi:hypothetical protein